MKTGKINLVLFGATGSVLGVSMGNFLPFFHLEKEHFLYTQLYVHFGIMMVLSNCLFRYGWPNVFREKNAVRL